MQLTTEQNYWLEVLDDAFYGEGLQDVFSAIPTEKRDAIAKSLDTAHDCYGMAFYSPPASDMVNNEVRELKAKIKALEKEAEDWRCAFRKNVEMRHPQASRIDLQKDGNATYFL